jgi:hypothetical protein
MACDNCGHTMQGLGDHRTARRIFWCPRCGGLKYVVGDYEEFEPAKWTRPHQGAPLSQWSLGLLWKLTNDAFSVGLAKRFLAPRDGDGREAFGQLEDAKLKSL